MTHETLVFATIERLQYEDWDAVCERYKINTDEMREPDAAGFELRKRAQEATEPQLIRMLMELALLPSGWSDEPLEHNDPLASVARRYEVSLTAKKTPKAKSAKCEPKKKVAGRHRRRSHHAMWSRRGKPRRRRHGREGRRAAASNDEMRGHHDETHSQEHRRS